MSKKHKHKKAAEIPGAKPNQVIIVGEDDKAAREHRAECIREHLGCEIVTIADGGELPHALEKCTREGKQVKGILIDNTMEAIDGAFVIGSLRHGEYDHCYHGSAQIPVVMITGDVSKIINKPSGCHIYTKADWYKIQDKDKWGSALGQILTSWIEYTAPKPPEHDQAHDKEATIDPVQLGKDMTEATNPGRRADLGGYIADDGKFNMFLRTHASFADRLEESFRSQKSPPTSPPRR